MMSLKSKRELLAMVRPRYLKVSKVEKQKMLDELRSATGYHRKHAIRVLKNQGQAKTIYRGEVVDALEQIWEIYRRIYPKRLQPFLPKAILGLERCKEIGLSQDTTELPLKISSASIDHTVRIWFCRLQI